jgi:hypothetical protein
VAGALMMTVFISLAGWRLWITTPATFATPRMSLHRHKPPAQKPLLLLPLRHRRRTRSRGGRASTSPHLTGGTLGSGLGFRIWVQGYRVSDSDLGFRIRVSGYRV